MDIMSKRVIIYVDGGLCSQIQFLSLGYFFKSQGYDVKYDLRWFKKYGKDMDHKFDRSFVINKAFPNLDYKIASGFSVWLYRRLFRKPWTENNLPKHLYVKGYFDLTGKSFLKYKDIFIKYFKPVDAYTVKELLNEMESNNSCAVHVRRGDLARFNPVYGAPPTADYFLKAIKYVLKKRPDTVFYFFSDEIEWVRESIVPKLDKNTKFKICDKNGSEKGYLDMYLIVHAKSIIASQGSFGRMGKELNVNRDLLFVSRDTFKC